MWLHYGKKQVSDFKVLFYRPYRNRTCKCRIMFNELCLSVNCPSIKTREIMKCLRSAKKSIDICVFALSNKPIAAEVIDAHKRGVLVRVVVSNCYLLKSQELKRFKMARIEVKHQRDTFLYMHNKYSIVDNTWLIQGSMNWTHQAVFDNWENVVITNSPSLVSEFCQSFEKVWRIVDL